MFPASSRNSRRKNSTVFRAKGASERAMRAVFPLLLAMIFSGELSAQSTEESVQSQKRESLTPRPGPGPWWTWNTETGNWFGIRPALESKGVELFGGYTYVAQLWGNTVGKADSNVVYTGLLDFGVELDLEKAVGWRGASLRTTWLWISGVTVSEALAGNVLFVSDIAGFNTFRMLELWFQQELLDGKISIRAGQFTADSEFVRSDYSSLFLNSTFGWPALLYANLPGGGPNFPLGTLGVRVAAHPTDWFTFQSAAFQGYVYDQYTNPSGFRWRLDGQNGFFFLNEAQVRWNQRAQETGLPGQFKTGLWIQTGQMADVLAGSTNSGNYGWYFVLDQMLYRERAGAAPVAGGKQAVAGGAQKSGEGLGWFGRIGFADGDRNLADFYFDTGFTYKGLIPTRDADNIGLAFVYVQGGSGARNNPIVKNSFGDGEQMAFEMTYQAQITPWFVIQPDVQFIITPGSNLNLNNAFVIGGSVAIRF